MHASAVAIGGEALLICGPSRSGKSRLALALIARSTGRLPIEFVGDDRILLRQAACRLLASPHPRIAGFLERRGLGIIAMPWTAPAPVGGVISLGPADETVSAVAGVPRLEIDEPLDAAARSALVLSWWSALRATKAPHLRQKA